ncbi:MAG TPA: ABC transporter ATP-binding protein [Thermodesulfobacteriota bacterium]|nr:ABC transporter ATP-binding protein [Thermodesulfobacteriota bacterium]
MAGELLSVQRLTVRFGGLTAVNDLDFSIFPGEIVSLIGPNGAGKTTTFNAITGFLRASAGSVRFEGAELIHLKPHQIAEKGITRTFQITSLFPNLSALENIRTGHHMQERETFWDAVLNTRRKRRVEDETLARTAEILKFIGLEGKKGAMAGSLPYGDQRILEIGVALAANPRLLLLDEPSAGLNDTETQGMKELIQKMRARSITIFLVEHDMKLVMGLSDRIVVLNFGKKIATGTPEQVKTNPEVITAYLGDRKRDAKR